MKLYYHYNPRGCAVVTQWMLDEYCSDYEVVPIGCDQIEFSVGALRSFADPAA